MLGWKTFAPGSELPSGVLLPQQTHSTNIIKVVDGSEDLSNCDGLVTSNLELTLGVKTADCAPIIFIGQRKFGVIHCGWRGLVGGIIENMLLHFYDDAPQIMIGPLYPVFEIQRDFCYKALEQKFGQQFFDTIDDQITFRFLAAIQSIIPTAQWCGEDTFANSQWASWRRDGDLMLKKGQNVTVVGKNVECTM